MTGHGDIHHLREELEQLFDDLWRGPRFARSRVGFRPHIDVYRTESPPELVVIVDLAGVDPDDVKIVLHDYTLFLAGERKRPRPDRQASYHHIEIDYGPFERRLALPEAVDADAAHASYERGMLRIVLPLAEERRTAKVSIAVKTIR